MKITVEMSECDLKDICRLTGISKKGPAIRKLVADTLMMQRRAEIAQKFVSGEWSARLTGYEASRKRDRAKAHERSQAWRQ